MMKKLPNFLLSLLTVSFFSCQEIDKQNNQKQSYTSSNKTGETIEKILQRQVMNGYAIKEGDLDMMSDYSYQKEDYDAIKSISIDILKKNRFKFISDKEFQHKLTTIFHFKTQKDELNFLIEFPCSQGKTVYQVDGNYVISNNNPLFIDSQNKFLLEALFIPELINYKSKYPVIHQKEKEIPKEKIAEGTTVDVIKWADIKVLPDQQLTNSQKLIHRNKYLFNDAKESLDWLKINDQLFLEALVMTFGYTKDKNLVSFVLRNNYKNVGDLPKILWNERCNGDIVLNKEIFDIIAESSEPDQKTYLEAVSDYLVKEVSSNNSSLNKKASVKTEILGKIAYYSTKIGEKNNMYYTFFSILGSKDGGASYEQEFKKNNYYGISDFKQIWEETKTGGVSYPGME